MNKFRFTLTAFAIMAFTLMIASSAQGQTATRTWVSGTGNDANPCSRTAPCKTFAGAIVKTAAGGEISVLDPGGFGAVTITKALTINGEGTLAGIAAAQANGIVINAGANDTVNLRYLSINGAGNSPDGIRVLSAKNVNIEKVWIGGFTGDGIEVFEGSEINLSVKNTTISTCAGAGIKVETSANLARATIRDTQITNCGTAILARRNSRVSVVHSTLASNAVGVHVEGNGGTAVAVLKDCQVANNTGHGIQAGGGAATNASVARVSNNIINNNGGSGLSIQANGSVDTFANNEINGNTTDGCVGCTNVTATIG